MCIRDRAECEALIDRANQLAEEACCLDKEQKYKEALKKYNQAIQYFEFIVKHKPKISAAPSINASIEKLSRRIQELLKRAKPRASLKEYEETKDNILEKVLKSAITIDKPKLRWKNVAVVKKAKTILKETLRMRENRPNVILLHGPPGTGKIYLAQACAAEMNATLYSVYFTDVAYKWRQYPCQITKSIFEQAKANPLAVIFIGEVQILVSKADKISDTNVVGELIKQLSNITDLTVIIGSNYPWDINPNVLPLVQKRVYIPLHDAYARTKLLRLKLSEFGSTITKEEYKQLRELTESYLGSNIDMLARNAQMVSIRKCRSARKFAVRGGFYVPTCPSDPFGVEYTMATLPNSSKLKPPPICMGDLINIINSSTMKATNGIFGKFKTDIERYEKWNEEFGSKCRCCLIYFRHLLYS
eukprot:TRINITY_DN13510_c0_g2_i2.p1 TRINITY_DN13510_c0_g2~~TRINITY_DN13510_c0_g2_i2.p1  ORF type:complete len:417 (-),score=75.48 TRINITY_DN13510_c0_g2_i2:110-1360(-)